MGFLSRPGAGTGGNYHDAELPVYQYGEDGTKHNKNADFRRLDREGYSADFGAFVFWVDKKTYN